MPKRLYRSKDNKIFAGVVGGLGEYFDVDPVALRLLWVVATAFTAMVPGIIAYILAVMVVPLKPEHVKEHIRDVS